MKSLSFDSRHALRDRETRSLAAYEAAIYPLFLVAALAGRIVPGRGDGRRPGVFAEARDMTFAVVPWFFQWR